MDISGSLSQILKGLCISSEMPMNSFIGLPINDTKGKQIGVITSIDLDNDLWHGTVSYDFHKEADQVSMEIDTAQKHKEELIKQVKLLEQEIIDRAEDIVGSNDLRASLEIILTFECRSTYLSKRFIDDIMDIPSTVVRNGIPLNAIRERLGFEPIDNYKG